MKYKCSLCGIERELSQFDRKGEKRFSRCKECRHKLYEEEKEKNLERAKAYYEENKEEIKKRQQIRRNGNIPKEVLRSARQRAIKKGLEFNIDESDITIPEFCPVLGIKLEKGKGVAQKNSPSIDRIDSNKGYVKGNVIIVSYLANTIKTNATIDEIKKVVEFYEKL